MFRSKLVDFHVGPEGTNFTVHAQPLARLSQPLNTLINGNMLEAKTGVIDWKDTDEETFLRFCEFAYVQDYTPPRFGECSNRDKPKQGDLETADLTGSGLVSRKKGGKANGHYNNLGRHPQIQFSWTRILMMGGNGQSRKIVILPLRPTYYFVNNLNLFPITHCTKI